jgi:protein TonB
MAVLRLLRPVDEAARTAALPLSRLVQDGSLRTSQRSRPAHVHHPWTGAAVSLAIHAVLLATFLWQSPGGERTAQSTTIEIVFRQAADASVESPSGDVQTEVDAVPDPAPADQAAAEAPPVEQAALAPAELPPPPPEPVAEVAAEPPPPVEQVALAPVEPPPPPLESVAKVAAEPPPPEEQAALAPAEPAPPEPMPEVAVEPLPAPPPSRPMVRQRPVETPRVAPKPTHVAVEPAREEAPTVAAAPAASGSPAESAAPVSTAAAPAAAAPPPQPQGEIPVIHEARFREPPRPARYPSRAIDLSQQGTVIVRALVAPDGKADDIVVWRSSGYALLDAAALRAVRGWSFEPARMGSRRITAWVEVPVRFAIR